MSLFSNFMCETVNYLILLAVRIKLYFKTICKKLLDLRSLNSILIKIIEIFSLMVLNLRIHYLWQ